MTTTLESTSSAASVARKLAYRRLAAAILRLDVESLTEDLQVARRRGAVPVGIDLQSLRVAALPACSDRQVALR